MTKIWFTSDTHFGHKNIIHYCERPFNSLTQMHEVLIRNWNERVKPEDTVIFLGDFCFRNTKGGKDGEGALHRADYYIKQLNGNIVFIRGNHDNNNSLNTKIKSLVIEIAGHKINCVHDPAEADLRYRMNFVGHVHQNWKIKKMNWGVYLINLSVDVWKFRPVSIQDILKEVERFKKRKSK